MGDSEMVIIEVNLDDDSITIVPAEGGVYTYYPGDEVDNDRIERLIAAGATYTVYSQGEVVTQEEIEELRRQGYNIGFRI